MTTTLSRIKYSIQGFSLLAVLSIFLISPGALFATNSSDPVPNPPSDFCAVGDANSSSYCQDKIKGDTVNPVVGESSLLKKVLQFVTVATGITSVIMLMFGGFKYILSGGDSNSVKAAKDTILYSVIGLVVAIFGQVIITFVLDQL